jgi:hypothetical protein
MLASFMSTGFKEWALICEALGTGAQSVILRKGGIAEGRAGFRFAHDEFLLFPTLFHEQVNRLKLPPESPLPAARADGQIEIRYRARVEWTLDVTDPALLPLLAPFHLWRDEIVEERFRYDGKAAISLAFVRAYRLEQPFVFPDEPKYGGCRSWVTLPEVPAAIGSTPALDDATHQARERELRALLSARGALATS